MPHLAALNLCRTQPVMPKRAAKVDDNQGEIVGALRAVGALVFPAHTVGSGFPDLVVLFRGVVYLIEVKDGSKPPSARKLTPDQQKFHEKWASPALHVVETVDQALAAIGLTIAA